MKRIKREILIKLLISIIFIILSIITSFNIGKKFYELKNTIINNNQKVNIKAIVLDWKLKFNFIVENEVIELE